MIITFKKRLFRKKILLLAFLLCLFFNRCNDNVVYDNYISIDNNTWDTTQLLKFDVPIEDTTQPYNFVIKVRNNADYEFQNLFLFLTTTMPDYTVYQDTMECILAKNDGEWLGRGFGAIKTNKYMFKYGVTFPQKGVYNFEIIHGMRSINLTGITDVGIRIERFTHKNTKK